MNNEYISLLVEAEKTTNRADAVRLINRATQLRETYATHSLPKDSYDYSNKTV